MKNRTVMLLSLLAANDSLGQPEVHRTVLVKQAFLAETIRPLYRKWQQTFAFVRYYYGPYSDDIFPCLDTLVFNGLVEVVSAERRGGRLRATYRITKHAYTVLKEIGADDFLELAKDLVWALQTLGIDQAGDICKLVYQEHSFAQVFARHKTYGIGPETKVHLPSVTSANNDTFVALSILDELYYKNPGKRNESSTFRISTREVVRIFLKCLAMRVPKQQSTLKLPNE